MYSFKLNNLKKNTVEIVLTVPKEDIVKEYEAAFKKLMQELEVEGFRKGKVPKSIAEKHLSRDMVYEQVIRSFVPRVYSEIVQKENLKPIVSPRIDFAKAKENEDWELKFTTALAPKVLLGKYKEKIQAAKKELSKSDIWIPGKSKEPTEEEKEKKKQAEFQAGLQALLTEAKVEIADVILDEEVEKRLTKLVDDVQKVGLTMDSYLKSKNITKEQLSSQIRKEIEESYKIEFILQEIADSENIKVEQVDLERIFATIKDEKEKESAKKNAYYYAAVLRKQKTLDYINSL